MIGRLLASLLLMAIPAFNLASDAVAGDLNSAIARCAAIASNANRLKCFDQISKQDSVEQSGGVDTSCRIEDWNYSEKADSIYINGTTTCPSGKLIYRLYDGETHKFIASKFTYFEGFSFQSYADGMVPKKLEIKYTIELR